MDHSLTQSTNFKFQYTACMLTYKYHLPKEDFIVWIKKKCPKIEFIRMAHEKGHEDEETPYEHSHVVIKFSKRFVTENPRFFDYEVEIEETHECEIIHPHIKGIDMRKKIMWENMLNYIAKEDPENSDLKRAKTVVEKIWSCESLDEALKKNVTSPGDVSGVVACYRLKSQDFSYWINKFDNWIPYIWQQKVIDVVKSESDGRSVHWFYEENGRTGKSELIDYLHWKIDADSFTLIENLGGHKDTATIMESALMSGWNGHCILIDMPRTTERNDGFYTSLESLVNGRITVQKYQGKLMYFPKKPHIVVFANWLPKMYREDKDGNSHAYLSIDRWQIVHINAENCKHPIAGDSPAVPSEPTPETTSSLESLTLKALLG